MSCPTGGLPSIRHNEMRYLLAHAVSDVCMDVTIEPQLEEYGERQPVHDEESCGNVEHLRLDIRARGFMGGSLEVALFDVRVFNPSLLQQSIQPLNNSTAGMRQKSGESMKPEQRLGTVVSHPRFSPQLVDVAPGRSGSSRSWHQN